MTHFVHKLQSYMMTQFYHSPFDCLPVKQFKQYFAPLTDKKFEILSFNTTSNY